MAVGAWALCCLDRGSRSKRQRSGGLADWPMAIAAAPDVHVAGYRCCGLLPTWLETGPRLWRVGGQTLTEANERECVVAAGSCKGGRTCGVTKRQAVVAKGGHAWRARSGFRESGCPCGQDQEVRKVPVNQ